MGNAAPAPAHLRQNAITAILRIAASAGFLHSRTLALLALTLLTFEAAQVVGLALFLAVAMELGSFSLVPMLWCGRERPPWDYG